MSGNILIIKRNGKAEPFSVDKIKNAISRAFLSVGSFATQEILTDILGRLSIHNGMSVEEIQNQVEFSLMSEKYFTVAKSYILYRQSHLEDREVRDKLQFLADYSSALNSATGSKYDANANVENKNIATLIGEFPPFEPSSFGGSYEGDVWQGSFGEILEHVEQPFHLQK